MSRDRDVREYVQSLRTARFPNPAPRAFPIPQAQQQCCAQSRDVGVQSRDIQPIFLFGEGGANSNFESKQLAKGRFLIRNHDIKMISAKSSIEQTYFKQNLNFGCYPYCTQHNRYNHPQPTQDLQDSASNQPITKKV